MDDLQSTGDASQWMQVAYDDLRALAHSYLNRERGYHTLQPTALVHEAYLRLVKINRIRWRDKTHFFAFAATQMRRILVEHARARLQHKRGGGMQRLTLHDAVLPAQQAPVDLLSLDLALQRLERRSARQCRVAELRIFSGMLVSEVSQVLEVSERTVKSDWAVARAWLAAQLRTAP